MKKFRRMSKAAFGTKKKGKKDKQQSAEKAVPADKNESTPGQESQQAVAVQSQQEVQQESQQQTTVKLKWNGSHGILYSESDLRQKFSPFGTILHLYINKNGNRAALQFSSYEEAHAVIHAPGGHGRITTSWPDQKALKQKTGLKSETPARHNAALDLLETPQSAVSRTSSAGRHIDVGTPSRSRDGDSSQDSSSEASSEPETERRAEARPTHTYRPFDDENAASVSALRSEARNVDQPRAESFGQEVETAKKGEGRSPQASFRNKPAMTVQTRTRSWENVDDESDLIDSPMVLDFGSLRGDGAKKPRSLQTKPIEVSPTSSRTNSRKSNDFYQVRGDETYLEREKGPTNSGSSDALRAGKTFKSSIAGVDAHASNAHVSEGLSTLNMLKPSKIDTRTSHGGGAGNNDGISEIDDIPEILSLDAAQPAKAADGPLATPSSTLGTNFDGFDAPESVGSVRDRSQADQASSVSSFSSTDKTARPGATASALEMLNVSDVLASNVTISEAGLHRKQIPKLSPSSAVQAHDTETPMSHQTPTFQSQILKMTRAMRFRVGDRVEARYGGQPNWHSARITSAYVDPEGADFPATRPVISQAVEEQAEEADMLVEGSAKEKYDLLYDDGDSETGVLRYQIRRDCSDAKYFSSDAARKEGQHLEAEEGRELRLGLRVDACHRGGRQAYPGKVSVVHRDGTYGIVYEDGDREGEESGTGVARNLIFGLLRPSLVCELLSRVGGGVAAVATAEVEVEIEAQKQEEEQEQVHMQEEQAQPATVSASAGAVSVQAAVATAAVGAAGAAVDEFVKQHQPVAEIEPSESKTAVAKNSDSEVSEVICSASTSATVDVEKSGNSAHMPAAVIPTIDEASPPPAVTTMQASGTEPSSLKGSQEQTRNSSFTSSTETGSSGRVAYKAYPEDRNASSVNAGTDANISTLAHVKALAEASARERADAALAGSTSATAQNKQTADLGVSSSRGGIDIAAEIQQAQANAATERMRLREHARMLAAAAEGIDLQTGTAIDGAVGGIDDSDPANSKHLSMAEAKAMATATEAALGAYKRELRALQMQVSQLQTENQSLGTGHQASEARVRHLQVEANAAMLELDSSARLHEEEVRKWVEELTVLQVSKKNADEHVLVLRRELREARGQLAAQTSACAGLDKENRRLRQRVVEAEGRTQAALATVVAMQRREMSAMGARGAAQEGGEVRADSNSKKSAAPEVAAAQVPAPATALAGALATAVAASNATDAAEVAAALAEEGNSAASSVTQIWTADAARQQLHPMVLKQRLRQPVELTEQGNSKDRVNLLELPSVQQAVAAKQARLVQRQTQIEQYRRALRVVQLDDEATEQIAKQDQEILSLQRVLRESQAKTVKPLRDSYRLLLQMKGEQPTTDAQQGRHQQAWFDDAAQGGAAVGSAGEGLTVGSLILKQYEDERRLQEKSQQHVEARRHQQHGTAPRYLDQGLVLQQQSMENTGSSSVPIESMQLRAWVNSMR